MINNLLDADDTDDADFIILLIAHPLNPRYPCHPRLKNNIPNGANHLSPNTNHFCSFLFRYEAIIFYPTPEPSHPANQQYAPYR